MSIPLIATATFGLEAVVSRELEALGFEDRSVEDGRVTFSADWADVCRCNLWLRSADRVFWKVAEFPAVDFDELFDQVNALDWGEWLPQDAKFPVAVRLARSQLKHPPSCQSIVKKAIVESLRRRYPIDVFPESGPLYAVDVSVVKDRVLVGLDTTGSGLHKRGYRVAGGASPLKETLAAGLVQLSFWNRERPLIDPFCGSGTIAIEAALIGRNAAPGLARPFVSEQWPQISERIWSEARTAAREAYLDEPLESIVATDVDGSVLRAARENAKHAGVDGDIHFQQSPAEELSTSRRYGCVICNPPYGERSGDSEVARTTTQTLARQFKEWETWSAYVLTAYPELERIWGQRADRRRKLFNGGLACTYYQYHGPRPPRRANLTNSECRE